MISVGVLRCGRSCRNPATGLVAPSPGSGSIWFGRLACTDIKDHYGGQSLSKDRLRYHNCYDSQHPFVPSRSGGPPSKSSHPQTPAQTPALAVEGWAKLTTTLAKADPRHEAATDVESVQSRSVI